MSKTASFWLVAGLTAVIAAPAAAQDADRAKARALIAQVMGGQTTVGQPAGAAAAQTQEGPTVELTSEQAVARALDKNLTLASQRITPETWDLAIAANLANYRPNLTSAFSNQSAVQLNTNLFAGGNRVTQDTQNWSGGLAQNVWKGGGNYTVNFTNQRAASDATNSTVNPSYQSGLRAQYVQPLLKNFKIDQNRALVQSNRISQDISEIALKSTTASTVAQVRNAYWELVYARQAVDAAQASLDLASKLVADNRSRVEIGTMAPIDVVQAQADEATRRQTLVNAQATLRNDELALKRLIVSGTDDELWRATIVPTDLPTAAPQAVDLEGGGPGRAPEPHRYRDDAEEPGVDRRAAPHAGQPDAAAARFHRHLHAERPRRHRTAARPAESAHHRRHHPGRLYRCAPRDWHDRRADVERAGAVRAANRHQRAQGQRRAAAAPPPPDRG